MRRLALASTAALAVVPTQDGQHVVAEHGFRPLYNRTRASTKPLRLALRGRDLRVVSVGWTRNPTRR